MFWWIFKSPAQIPRTNGSNPDGVFSKYTKNVIDFKDPDFEKVDLNKVYSNKIPTEVYFQKNPL